MNFRKVLGCLSCKSFSAVPLAIFILTCITQSHAGVRAPQTIIHDITTTLESETNQVERAKLYCYRARQYVELKNFEAAETDYLTALGQDINGWIMYEFGYFLYKDGQFEKAYKLAYNLEKNFPGFAVDARKLSKKAKEKYQEQHLKENPPTIVMNTTPNYGYKSRRQLIEEVKRQEKARFQSNKDVIYSECKQKWGNDYRMVEYCIDDQTKARNVVVKKKGGVIKSECEQKWGTDYRMVEYCIGEQSKAKQKVNKWSGGTIKNECQQKWGTDYRMVEYCIKEQVKAKRSIESRYN